MKKIYYLKTCSTCIRILKELEVGSDFILQDIKSEPITFAQLEAMKSLSGSYEKLFSKRAQLYKKRNLKDVTLTEENYRDLILEHYTFLSRPVIVIGNSIFVGNSKQTVEAAKLTLNEK